MFGDEEGGKLDQGFYPVKIIAKKLTTPREKNPITFF